MKAEDLKKLILQADDDLPEDLRRHIEGSAELTALFQRTRAVRNLMSLKAYERPTDGFDTRVRQDIMRQIRHLEPETKPTGWWQVLAAPLSPAWRYGAVAAVLAVVVVHALTTPATRVSEANWSNPEAVAEVPVPEALGPVMLASTNLPNYELERLIRVIPTDREGVSPGQIQYGPVRSVPVSY